MLSSTIYLDNVVQKWLGSVSCYKHNSVCETGYYFNVCAAELIYL